MKTLKTILSILAIVFGSLTMAVAQSSYGVNPEKSNLKWVGKKVTGQHNGIISVSDGSLTVNDGNITAGTFTIDMTSIEVLDLTGDMKGKLEGHLASDDFFSVANNPTATFTITKAESKGGNKFDITGNLTIKGITNEISFPAKVVLNKAGFIADAEFTIDRTKWDVRYGSGSFFEGLGDKTIYDDIELKLYVVSK